MTKPFICIVGALLVGACTSFATMKEDPNSEKPAHHTESGFKNLYTGPISKGPLGFVKMRLFGEEKFANQAKNAHKVPIADPELNLIENPGEQPQISWLGHSTFLIQYAGVNILTDPVLTNRVSPVSFAGPTRLVEMPIKRYDLPEIDYIVISHNHYDHLDAGTIAMFGDEPIYIVPLKLGEWFVDEGIDPERVIEFDWWDSESFDEKETLFTATPSQHWSARGLFDRFATLWAAWHIQIKDYTIWFGGDTGYNDVQFKEIGEHFESIDLGLIPIGAYAPRWFMKQQHVNPEEAVQIHKDIKAKQSIGMHWGTFQLTAEPIDEPVKRLKAAETSGQIKPGEFVTIAIGETILVDIESKKLNLKTGS